MTRAKCLIFLNRLLFTTIQWYCTYLGLPETCIDCTFEWKQRQLYFATNLPNKKNVNFIVLTISITQELIIFQQKLQRESKSIPFCFHLLTLFFIHVHVSVKFICNIKYCINTWLLHTNPINCFLLHINTNQ